MTHPFDEPPRTPEQVVAELSERPFRRLLLTGAPGTGKSALAAAIAAVLASAHERVCCVSADPGTPAFGVPGAVSLACWERSGWRVFRMEPLCTLDAGRFRLPLVDAVRRLCAQAGGGTVLVDAPGVVRGTPGAELLLSLAEILRPDLLLLAGRGRHPLVQEIRALDIPCWPVTPAPEAVRPSKRARERARTQAWDAYLENARPGTLDIHAISLLGTPPPLDVPDAWNGRQAACLGADGEVVFGEVSGLQGDRLTLRVPELPQMPRAVVVRDARRDATGRLATAERFAERAVFWSPPGDIAPSPGAAGPAPVAEVGPVSATLVNGVFGDPLLHLRLRYRRRSLLFDLGESGRLPARVVHQVTDVFISHAHADHIGGFMAFLRARIGLTGACRFFGPPGLARNVQGLVDGVCWDRIGDAGPRFDVAELHDERLHRFRVQAGRDGPQPLERSNAAGGVVLEEPDFRVRAATLDHGTPVLAFAFEPRGQANVRKERLEAMDVPPGPWLTELKRAWLAGDDEALIRLPDGQSRSVAELAAQLLLAAPGRRVVYATDLADTTENRRRLTALARHAHTLICEATFLPEHAAQARNTGHLTARACGEIATAADVSQLIPFHFSPRYQDMPERVFAEVARWCSRTVMPRGR